MTVVTDRIVTVINCNSTPSDFLHFPQFEDVVCCSSIPCHCNTRVYSCYGDESIKMTCRYGHFKSEVIDDHLRVDAIKLVSTQ